MPGTTQTLSASEQRQQDLRHQIYLCMKANEVPVTGELFFNLIFCTETQLVKIAHELHIKTS